MVSSSHQTGCTYRKCLQSYKERPTESDSSRSLHCTCHSRRHHSALARTQPLWLPHLVSSSRLSQCTCRKCLQNCRERPIGNDSNRSLHCTGRSIGRRLALAGALAAEDWEKMVSSSHQTGRTYRKCLQNCKERPTGSGSNRPLHCTGRSIGRRLALAGALAAEDLEKMVSSSHQTGCTY